MKNKAGRKTIETEKARNISITIRVTEEENKEIEDMAKYIEAPKTRLMRNLILMQLDEMKSFRKYGILHIAKGVLKTIDFVKSFNEMKKMKTLNE